MPKENPAGQGLRGFCGADVFKTSQASLAQALFDESIAISASFLGAARAPVKSPDAVCQI
jgi:hypothetical protein